MTSDHPMEQPVFREPWEAQVFALVTALIEQGALSSSEWSQTLGSAIKSAQQQGDPDTGDTYYQHWIAALEMVLAEKELASAEEIKSLIEAWRKAYLTTPHGQPVELGTGGASQCPLVSHSSH